VSLPAPFSYTQTMWMTLLGFVLFAQIPDQMTLFGGVIVIASGLYVLHRERAVGAKTAVL
jgi:drug/metabolite transporter (DMT)-like permease